MKDNILWIFLHPIRTGGNTLIEHIKKQVPADEIFLSSVARYKCDVFSKFDRNKTRFALGHATYYGMHKLAPNKEARYFIFLRDPAERVLSYYNTQMQLMNKKIPFDIWYKHQVKNDLVNFLDLKYRGSESSKVYTPQTFYVDYQKI